MNLKERVEQALRERGGDRLRLSGGRRDREDGYVVEEVDVDEARVRYGREIFTQWSGAPDPGRSQDPDLVSCAEVLEDAGFRVEPVGDPQGGYLRVTEG